MDAGCTTRRRKYGGLDRITTPTSRWYIRPTLNSSVDKNNEQYGERTPAVCGNIDYTP